MKNFICILLSIFLSFSLIACDININISEDDTDQTTPYNDIKEKTSKNEENSSSGNIISDDESLTNIFKNDKEEKQVLIVGTTVFEPYGFKNEDGNWTGVEVDILNEIAKKLDVELVFKECVFENIMQDLYLGEIDIAATALTRTEKRLEIANASVEIYPNYEELEFAVFYTSKDNPNLTKAIDNAIIEIQLDGIVDEILEKYDEKYDTKQY